MEFRTRANHLRLPIQMCYSRAIPSQKEPALPPLPGAPAGFFNPYTLRPYHALMIVASVITTTVMAAARL